MKLDDRIAENADRIAIAMEALVTDVRQVYQDNATLRVHCAEGPAHAEDRVRLRQQLRLVQLKLGQLLARYEFNNCPEVRDVLFTLDRQVDTVLNRSYEPEED